MERLSGGQGPEAGGAGGGRATGPLRGRRSVGGRRRETDGRAGAEERRQREGGRSRLQARRAAGDVRLQAHGGGLGHLCKGVAACLSVRPPLTVPACVSVALRFRTCQWVRWLCLCIQAPCPDPTRLSRIPVFQFLQGLFRPCPHLPRPYDS